MHPTWRVCMAANLTTLGAPHLRHPTFISSPPSTQRQQRSQLASWGLGAVCSLRCRKWFPCQQNKNICEYVWLLLLYSVKQEPINRSLYLPYYGLESTLSRGDLFIERLSGEVSQPHSSKTIKTELERVNCFTSHSP